MKLLKNIKEYIHNNPKKRKIIGIILILLGIVALITPFTPGSWLIFIGLQLLGFKFLLKK